MPQSLVRFIGAALLVLSVGVTSCQALVSDGRPAAEAAPALSTGEAPGG